MNTQEFVHGFTVAEQKSALDSIWDSSLVCATASELVWAAQLDTDIQVYLHHLANCDFDKTFAILTWNI